MNQETIEENIRELEEEGWKAEAPPAVERQFEHPDYQATLNFLVAIGDEVVATGAPMPSLQIENGTDVKLRVGGPPVRAISGEEIALAKALSTL